VCSSCECCHGFIQLPLLLCKQPTGVAQEAVAGVNSLQQQQQQQQQQQHKQVL
jgi:hypothetical protein